MRSMRKCLFVVILPALVGACATMPTANVASIADQSAVAERPEWMTGDRWVYRTAEGRTWTQEVLTKEGAKYAVRRGGARWIYSEDLGVQTTATNDFEPAIAYLSWPLKVKKSWEVDCLCKNTGYRVKGWPTVQAYEQITVPAGTFKAFRIYWEDGTRRPPQIYWYAPQVKNYVRWENHERGTVDELVEYRVR